MKIFQGMISRIAQHRMREFDEQQMLKEKENTKRNLGTLVFYLLGTALHRLLIPMQRISTGSSNLISSFARVQKQLLRRLLPKEVRMVALALNADSN